VTRGGAKLLLENFSSPYGKYVGHSLKNVGASQKTYGPDMNCIHFRGAVFLHVGSA